MNTLMIVAIFFGALAAPAQTIGDLNQLEGGVFASQDGEFLYLLAPAGANVKLGRVLLTGVDDPWVRLDNGIQKIPLENFGLMGAREVTLSIRKPSGELIDQKVENLAGKVTFFPAKELTLVEGQLWHPTISVIATGDLKLGLYVDLKRVELSDSIRKSVLPSGAKVFEYGGVMLPVGEHEIILSVRDSQQRVFSDTIRVRVLKIVTIFECSTYDCWNVLK